VESETKKCRLCDETRSLSEFHRNGKNKWNSRCKICISKINAEISEFNRECLAEVVGTKCMICFEEFHSSVIDYHHVISGDKEFNPSELIYKKTEVIMREVKKCIPLCSNHHRMHHNIEGFGDKEIGAYVSPITEDVINEYAIRCREFLSLQIEARRLKQQARKG